MDLILLPDGSAETLQRHYRQALSKATELYIVSAYLTKWDAPAKLNPGCKTFRLIIGRDFGITRKEACRAVMRWLPARLKNRFMVADAIEGFHPKAMFWRESDGTCHALIGSSNLTRAAFATNHEANIYVRVSSAQFSRTANWVRSMEPNCVSVSEDWLEDYDEAPHGGKVRNGKKAPGLKVKESLLLPKPAGATALVAQRREQLASYMHHRADLLRLFRECAARRVSSRAFYEQLPQHWSWDAGDRLQGAGWERQGRGSNFHQLSEAFIRIVDAASTERDDVVAEQIDWLHARKVPARTAFFSEMLCLRFPKLYPVINQPVHDYLSAIKFRGPRGASEGAHYVDLAQRLRYSLRANPKHPAKNIAELDAVIWLEYGKKD
jgi:HKD family nuclease